MEVSVGGTGFGVRHGLSAGGKVTVVMVMVAALTVVYGVAARADNVARGLPFAQDWNDTSLLTVSDDWDGVPGVTGYSPNITGNSNNNVNPADITADRSATVDVTANLTTLTGSLAGGVAEYQAGSDPTVVFRGSPQNDSPNVVLHLDTSGKTDVEVSYDLRDLDVTNDSVQHVALQYRVGNSGEYANVPQGYVEDATSQAQKTTSVSVVLPSGADDNPLVQVRIITSDASDASGAQTTDEWVGLDNVRVGASSTEASNSAPVNSVPGQQTTDEDSEVVFSRENGNAISTLDPDGDIEARATLGADHGDLYLVETAGLTVTGNGTGEVVATGDISSINAALDGLKYSPNPDYSGSDTLVFGVDDLGNTGSGGARTDTDDVLISVNAVDDPPTVDLSGDASADEGDTKTYTYSISDNDGPEASVAESCGQNAGLADTPEQDSFDCTFTDDGASEVTVSVEDGHGGSAGDGITVQVSNIPPLLSGIEAQTTEEDTAIDVPFTVTDVDDLTVSGASDKEGLISSVETHASENGGYYARITPATDVHGTADVEITAEEKGASGARSTGTFTLTVTPVNDAPTASADSYGMEEGGTLTADGYERNPSGVLANDVDVDGDRLSAAMVEDSGPDHGSIEFGEDGTFVYTPDADYSGSDSFAYRVGDSMEGGNTATVDIEVRAVNDVPVPQDDLRSTTEDTPLTFAADSLTINDSAGPGEEQNLTVTEVGNASNGTVEFSGTGDITFTPTQGFHGLATFDYTVCDDGQPAECSVMEATVRVNIGAVNSAPVAEDATLSTDEDTPVTVDLSGLASDGETADSDLIYEVSSGPGEGKGAAEIDGSVLNYTPEPGFAGTVGITYSVTDGGDGDAPAKSATGILSVTVNPVNAAPTVNPDSYEILEGDTLAATSGVLGNDDANDPGQTLTARLESGASHGQLSLDDDGTFSYTPDAGFVGEDGFSYRADDGAVKSNLSEPVWVTIKVVDRTPDATDDDATTGEDTRKVIHVLANDLRTSGAVVGIPSGGGPSRGRVETGRDGSVTYTPDANISGTDSFVYEVCGTAAPTDCDSATVNVTVTPVNDRPVAVSDGSETGEDRAVIVEVLANDTDVDGDLVRIGSIVQPENGRVSRTVDGTTLRYVPKADWSGTDTFRYRVNDGRSASEYVTVKIDVAPVNDAPAGAADSAETMQGQAVSIDVLLNDTDVDTTELDVARFRQPENGRVTSGTDGTLVYTPKPGFTGTDSFMYRPTDGSRMGRLVTVTVEVLSG